VTWDGFFRPFLPLKTTSKKQRVDLNAASRRIDGGRNTLLPFV